MWSKNNRKFGNKIRNFELCCKYSLANDKYIISDVCFVYLTTQNLISDKGLSRGKKGTKYKFTFEHPVPSNIKADLLLKDYTD